MYTTRVNSCKSRSPAERSRALVNSTGTILPMSTPVYYSPGRYAHASTSTGYSPSGVLHPSQDALRVARLEKFQSPYDQDKEVFKLKEEEKKKKKLEEKLKRYKGVGELGNKMTRREVSDEEKNNGLAVSRDIFQVHYENDVNEFTVEEEQNKIVEEENKRKKLEEKLERYKGVGELGNKMIQQVSEEEKTVGHRTSRLMLQDQFTRERQDNSKQEAMKNSVEQLTLEDEEDTSGSSTAGGQRLGGNSAAKVKGYHPLLERLASNKQEPRI